MLIGLAVVVTAASFAVARSGAGSAQEKITTLSEEVAQLEGGGGACPFEQLGAFNLQVQPQPLFPRQWLSGCGYLDHEGLRIERFTHDGPHGSYRLEFIKSGRGMPRRFIIYLNGGPRSMTTGLGPLPLRTQLIARLAESPGTGVLAPAYLGSWTRSLFPRADVEEAAEEIVSLIERLRALHPQAEISLVAVSAGTLVGLRILRRSGVPAVFTIPSPTSLRELVDDPRGTDVPPDAARRPVRFYRYRPGTRDLEEVTATVEEQMSAFAGDDYGRSLADLIGELPPRRRDCLAIVYGTEDRRVRNERLAEVRARFPSIPIRAIEGMGHGPADEEQAGALARAVDEIMPARCS